MNNMPQLKKNSRGTWETNVYLGKDSAGKRKYKHITAPTRSELNNLLLEVKTTLNAENINVKRMTVGEAVDKYIERRRATCSPKTIREYISYRKTFFQNLMPEKIGDLTDNILQKEIDLYAKDHSPKSVSNRWGLIRSAISFYDKDFNPRVELPAVKRKRLEMPDEQALFEMLKYIEGKKMELPILLAMTCGLRRGEITALDLDKDIDYERCYININKDMVLDEHNNWVIKPPKTDAANRLVPCPNWVIDKLAKARDNKYKWYTPNGITKEFSKLSEKFRIACSFHGLRHYYASIMDALGIPENYQMARMGHTTNEMLKRYQEYLKFKEVEVNDKLMSHMEKLNPNHMQQ